ncbi:hypothetical protein LJR013_003593 [Pseudarthrobacter oxydans]
MADITGSDAPFDPAFLDISAVNQALVKLFRTGNTRTIEMGAAAS